MPQARRIVIRPRTVVFALVLAAAPTAFSIFPEMGGMPLAGRIGIAAVWLVLAVLAAISTQRHERQLESILESQRLNRERLRASALDYALGNLLRPGTEGTPPGFQWTVYLFDESTELLMPVFPEGVADPLDHRLFAVGNGATGLAYQRKSLIVVLGDAVSDDSHGLTPEQQARFKEYRSVAGTPIWDPSENPIGVLTAIARNEDAYFETGPGRAVINQLAEVVGTLLTSLGPSS